MGQPSAKAALALGPGIRNRVRPREVVGAGWRDGGEWSGTGAGAARRSEARTEDAARKPTARSVMGLRTGRAGKGKIDPMEIVPLAGSIRGSPQAHRMEKGPSAR
jgi:hypothetical protein